MSTSFEKGIGLGVIGTLAVGGVSYALHQQQNFKTSQPIKNSKIFPQEIKSELTSRVNTFFGPESFKKIEGSFIIVVGLGGVGSHCANMLVRSGIGRIRLIDFDQVTLSSLNRHAVANMDDVGLSKSEAMKKRLKEIVPWCEVEAITQMFKGVDAETLLSGKPDYVLDCIDDVATKAELIAYCLKNSIPILTSMGAGGKADPTRLRISPLSDVINDPLASKIKWKLKKAHGVGADDVMCVFSAEKPKAGLLALDDDQMAAPQDYGAVDYIRLRVMPVLGTSPSIFGQAMASFILCKLGDKMYEPEVCERMSKNLKHKVFNFLKKNEITRFSTDREIDLDEDDVEFVVQEVWRSRCAVTGLRFGGHVCLALTRWDATKPPTADNLVMLMQKEADKLATKGQSVFSPEVVEKITERLAWASVQVKQDNDFLSTSGRVKQRAGVIKSQSVLDSLASISALSYVSWMGVFAVGYLLGSVKTR